MSHPFARLLPSARSLRPCQTNRSWMACAARCPTAWAARSPAPQPASRSAAAPDMPGGCGWQRAAPPRGTPSTALAAATAAACRPSRRRRFGTAAAAGDGGQSSGGNGDAEPPPVLGDWRAFRAKLVADSGSGGWAARQADANQQLLQIQVRVCLQPPGAGAGWLLAQACSMRMVAAACPALACHAPKVA